MAMSNSYVKLPAGISKKGVPCLDPKKSQQSRCDALAFQDRFCSKKRVGLNQEELQLR